MPNITKRQITENEIKELKGKMFYGDLSVLGYIFKISNGGARKRLENGHVPTCEALASIIAHREELKVNVLK